MSFFSKNKEKHLRSSKEGNTSFVKNVTSRVSGLLPSTVTKWFSSPTSSNANGSAQTADATDSSTEDEALDSPIITQPPAKRMRYNTPIKYDYPPPDVNCSVSNINPDPTYSYINTQFQSSHTTFKTSLRTPEEVAKEKTDRDIKAFKPQHSISNVGQSVADKRKSIFDTSTTEDSKIKRAKTSVDTTCNSKQPYFKPSLLGSPFYPGRTMYGGKASYINQPNINQKKTLLVNEPVSKADSVISTSARRVLDLLEQYSSPLIEAKRIPLYMKTKNYSFHDTSLDTPNQIKHPSYITQELYVPNVASILRLKQKSRLMDTTSLARQIIASHSSTADYSPYPSTVNRQKNETMENNKMTTKIKTNVTRINRENQNNVEVVAPINIQTAMLPIDKDSLPKFSIDVPTVSLPASTTSTPKLILTENKKSIESLSSKKEIVNNNFKFANPARLSCGINENKTTPPKYKFDSPEHSLDPKVEQKEGEVLLIVGNIKECEKSTLQHNDWKCSDCWVSNKIDVHKCICCGAKQPSHHPEKIKKCIVCMLADSQQLKDKCVNCETMKINNIPSSISYTQNASNTSKWKCEECWVSNDDNAAKCECCDSLKSKRSAAVSQMQVIAAPVLESANSDWKCGECWIFNKSSVDKCAACGSDKVGSKEKSTDMLSTMESSLSKLSNNSFKNIVTAQKEKNWECENCLIRNDLNKSTCVCCGAEKDNKTKVSETKFNFGLNTSFKFGIDPKVQEASLAKKLEQKSIPDTKTKENSEQNNNLAEEPAFVFTLPVKKPNEETVLSNAKLEEDPKPNYPFVILQNSTVLDVPTKPPSPVNSVQEKVKPEDVPKLDLSSSIQDTTKPLDGMSLPLLTQTRKENPSAELPSNFISSSILDRQKESTNFAITLKPAITSAEKIQSPFTLISSSLKPSSNMFSTSTTTTTSSNVFTQPLHTTVAPTVPSISMFKPAEPNLPSLFQKPNHTTSTVTLFQNNEPITTVAPLPASTAPIFSFGNNANSSAMSTEKPALFNFGTSTLKTDITPLFKSPFGVTNEMNVNNNNSFGLPGGNTLGTGSILPSLGGSNGISGANVVSRGSLTSGTVLSNNLLGGPNGISANPLGVASRFQPGNGLSGSPSGIFASTAQKENIWSSNTQPTNLFVSNTTANTLQKAAFTFGSSSPFNTSATPAFGSNAQPAQNMFGISNQNNNNNNNNNNNQPSMFSTPVQSQPPAPMFGVPQSPANNPAPQIGLFGSTTTGITSTFGGQNLSIPSFEAPSLAPAPAPAFNFGSQQSTAVFGFGQQQQPQQAGLYNFGAQSTGTSPVQFNMGSGTNTVVRRVRKAVRRTQPR